MLVTAEKVQSTVLDVPISVSALEGDQLAAAGLLTVRDIAHDVPGLSMCYAGPGLTEYEARGARLPALSAAPTAASSA